MMKKVGFGHKSTSHSFEVDPRPLFSSHRKVTQVTFLFSAEQKMDT